MYYSVCVVVVAMLHCVCFNLCMYGLEECTWAFLTLDIIWLHVMLIAYYKYCVIWLKNKQHFVATTTQSSLVPYWMYWSDNCDCIWMDRFRFKPIHLYWNSMALLSIFIFLLISTCLQGRVKAIEASCIFITHVQFTTVLCGKIKEINSVIVW